MLNLKETNPFKEAPLIGIFFNPWLCSSIVSSIQEVLLPHQLEVSHGHVIYFSQLKVGGDNLFQLKVVIFNWLSVTPKPPYGNCGVMRYYGSALGWKQSGILSLPMVESCPGESPKTVSRLCMSKE